MNDLKERLLKSFEELEGRIDTLSRCFGEEDELSVKLILDETRKTIVLVGFFTLYVRSVIPLSSSNDHTTRTVLNDFMIETTSGSRSLSSNLSEMLEYQKLKMKFNDSLKSDQEANEIFLYDFGLLKQSLIGQNVQTMININRNIREDFKLGRILFGKEWATKNCKSESIDSHFH